MVTTKRGRFVMCETDEALAKYPRHPCSIVCGPPLAELPRGGVRHKPRTYSPGLSDVQIEAVSLAATSHEQTLGNGHTGGFLNGDGTGIGKGRTSVGIIAENYNRTGNRVHVVVTASTLLLKDLQRDVRDISFHCQIINLADTHYSTTLPWATSRDHIGPVIIFLTYHALIQRNALGNTRIAQLLRWMQNEEFRGVLVFDESHKAKNVVSQTFEAVHKVQEACPKACVVYMSATPATLVQDLCYMTRLGMWGEGTCFPTFKDFSRAFNTLPHLELLCQDLAAKGKMVSRMLSFRGCGVRKVNCPLTSSQVAVYDQSVAWWQDLITAIKHEGGKEPYAAHLLFFKTLLAAFKVCHTYDIIDDALCDGQCVVIGLQSTGEASASADAKRGGSGDVSTPHEIALNTLNTVRTIEEKTMETFKERLLKMQLPKHAIDQLMQVYGADCVAEMTGRVSRCVPQNDGTMQFRTRAADCGGDTTVESVNLHELRHFMEGRKKIAVISDAVSCGTSLHADPRQAVTHQRLHITLELPWSAQKMLQQFGRTNRSGQAIPPVYVLLGTSVAGEERFASALTKRLLSLGALTQGDRLCAHRLSATMVDPNVSAESASIALHKLMTIATGTTKTKMGDITPHELQELFKSMNISLSVTTSADKFFNRLLGLRVHDQERLFRMFYDIWTREDSKCRYTKLECSIPIDCLCESGEVQRFGQSNTYMKPYSIQQGVFWRDINADLDSGSGVLVFHKEDDTIAFAYNCTDDGGDHMRILRPGTLPSTEPETHTPAEFNNIYRIAEETEGCEKKWREGMGAADNTVMIFGEVLHMWSAIRKAMTDSQSVARPTRIGNHIGFNLNLKMFKALCEQCQVELDWPFGSEDEQPYPVG